MYVDSKYTNLHVSPMELMPRVYGMYTSNPKPKNPKPYALNPKPMTTPLPTSPILSTMPPSLYYPRVSTCNAQLGDPKKQFSRPSARHRAQRNSSTLCPTLSPAKRIQQTLNPRSYISKPTLSSRRGSGRRSLNLRTKSLSC